MRSKTTFSLQINIVLLTIVSEFIAAGSFAQRPIKLTYENFLVPPTADYFQQGASPSGVSIPSAGANRTWDYGILTNNNTYNNSWAMQPANSPAFPTARRQHTYFSNFIPGLPILFTDYEGDNPNRYFNEGRAIARQAFPIQALTGFPTDSLIITDQVIHYPGTTNLKYAATYLSTWTYSETIVTNFQLSVALFGLNHVPGQVVQHETQTRQVVGWGKMKVPFGTGESKFIPVLMIKNIYHRLDSFYLGGFPAPAALIGAFGLSQAQQTNGYGYSFKRRGIDNDLMYFDMNSSFTAINYIQYDTKRLDIYCDEDESVKMCINGHTRCVEYEDANHALLNQHAAIGACAGNTHCDNEEDDNNKRIMPGTISSAGPGSVISVYPNPSSYGFTLVLDSKVNIPASVFVFDLSGRQVLKMENVSSIVQFGKQLQAGTYIVRVIQDRLRKEFKLIKTQ